MLLFSHKLLNSHSKSDQFLMTLLILLYRHSKDLNALRCHERQMLKLADMIKTSLNEVGCEELPSGCDDLSVDQNFIENSVVPVDQPVSSLTNRIYNKMEKGSML